MTSHDLNLHKVSFTWSESIMRSDDVLNEHQEENQHAGPI